LAAPLESQSGFNERVAVAQAHVELSRDLSLFDITMIGVGAMIGAGIFVLTGIAAGAAGPALIVSFALNGIITLFTAMAYAELGSAIPGAGGGYLWVKEGLPGPTAFLAGWMDWFAHSVAGSLYALGFGAHIGLVLQEFGIHIAGLGEVQLQKVFGAIIILIFVYINYRGASETGAAGNIITVLKVMIIGLFIASGLWAIYGNPSYLQKFENFSPNGLAGVFSAMGLTFIAFEGYEIIVQAGEEVKDPRRNIPRAVFLSLAIVIPIYLLVAFVSMGAVNPETDIPTYQWLAEHAELGVVEAARQFMPLGTILLIIGGILSTMSALNATTYSSTRVSFAMGRDRNLPDAFADVHPRTRTPYKALFLSGVVILGMAVAIPIEDVATAADVMFLLLFIQVNVAAITLRKKYGDRLSYGFLMPFFPYIPIVVIIIKLGLALFMFGYSPIAWYITLAWIASGVVFYLLYARPREDKSDRSTVISEAKLLPNPVDPAQYRVLVPIANPESLQGLLEPALNAARQHDGAITLLHVISVPDQLPLSAGREYLQRSEELRSRALEMMEHEDVPLEVEVRISHNLVRAIVETAEEKTANLLIMGWRGQSFQPGTRIGKNIDDLIDRVNCKVLVVQQELIKQPRRILIPVQDPQQVRFALEAVGYLTGAPVVDKVIAHVFPENAPTEAQEEFFRQVRREIDAFEKRFPKTRGSIKTEGFLAPDPLEAIVQASAEYDHVIIGATRDGWLKRRFFDSFPMILAERIEVPVALTRPRTNVFGFGLRQILNYFWGGYLDIEPRSQRELMELGLLLPPDQAKPYALATAVNRPALLLTGVLGIGSAVSIYAGGGGTMSWIGSAGFVLALWLFTAIAMQPSPQEMDGPPRP
jgi:amino acid transporter/nucleotide-binding universal stress UspA family protein